MLIGPPQNRRVLLTFTGFHDPYSEVPVAGGKQQGPILSLLGERPFDVVVLFSTPSTAEVTRETAAEISRLYPDIKVEVVHLQLPDPTDYVGILRGLRSEFPGIEDTVGDAEFYIATASGTPQMHACWMMLASSGEIPARLLHIRPPRFVTAQAPMVAEVDLSGDDFPMVQSRFLPVPEDLSRFAADRMMVEASVPMESLQHLARRPSRRAWLDTVASIEPGLEVLAEQAGIVGDDPAFLKALSWAAMVARYEEPVLIMGENGTGKEMVAKLIHQNSSRSAKTMVTMNCSAIPEELAESILFGHKKGAFTGAIADSKGKFREADGSTLFLDEVGELSLSIQAKLLRAVELHVVEPIGEPTAKVDIRLVTATNKNLEEMVRAKSFREDLYFRLKGASIEVPPLRERRSDITKLAAYFLDRFGRKYNRHWVLSPEALSRLHAHSWPGNVRELQNLVHEAAMGCRGREIRPEHLRLNSGMRSENSVPDPHPGFSLKNHLTEVRRKLFERALEIARGNQSEAAQLLGVTAAAVSKFLKGEPAVDD